MNDQSPLPRFRKPPISEVVVGVQFQAPALTPVHLGLYYQRVKARFPTAEVQPPLPLAFETFGSPMVPFPYPGSVISPRMWFRSADELIPDTIAKRKVVFQLARWLESKCLSALRRRAVGVSEGVRRIGSTCNERRAG